MPRFGFVGESNIHHILTLGKPALFISISGRSWNSASKFEGLNVISEGITDQWYCHYEDRETINKMLKDLYDKIAAFGDDDLIIFGCDYGRSRSRDAASAFARLFNQDKLSSAFSHTNPGEEEFVVKGHDFELSENIMVDALYDRYHSILSTSEKSK